MSADGCKDRAGLMSTRAVSESRRSCRVSPNRAVFSRCGETMLFHSAVTKWLRLVPLS